MYYNLLRPPNILPLWFLPFSSPILSAGLTILYQQNEAFSFIWRSYQPPNQPKNVRLHYFSRGSMSK